MRAGERRARSVSRRFILATLVALPLAAVLLIVSADQGDAILRTTPRSPAHRERARSETSKQAPPARASAVTIGPATPAATAQTPALTQLEKSEPGMTPAASRIHAATRDALLDRAGAVRATAADRAEALDRLRRAPGLDEAAVAKLATIVADAALGADTRTRALDVLHQLATFRPDLARCLTAALLDSLSHAPDDAARAFVLETLSTKDASPGEVEGVTAWLGDPNPRVRAAAARAVATAPLRDRSLVTRALERALASESDAETAAVLIEASLRAGRGSASALLARLERASVVRGSAALARQIADYRSSLDEGETDPLRILAEHDAREAR